MSTFSCARLSDSVESSDKVLSDHEWISRISRGLVSKEVIVMECPGFDVSSRCADRLLFTVFGNTFLGLEESKET